MTKRTLSSTRIQAAPGSAAVVPAKTAEKRRAGEQVGATLVASENEGAAAVPLEITSLDTAKQLAGTQTLLRGLAVLEAAASGAHDLRAFAAALAGATALEPCTACMGVELRVRFFITNPPPYRPAKTRDRSGTALV